MRRWTREVHPRGEKERGDLSALLVGNGEPPPRSLLKELGSSVDLVVAADGGANVARGVGLTPDVIIGDLDSITPETKRVFAHSLLLHVARQDNTDLEKALDFLVTRKIRKVLIAGVTGRRMDFTLANMAVLWSYARRLNWTVVGDGWYAKPVRRSLSVVAPRGTAVSLIPYSMCAGVTLRGLQYPLVNGSLSVGKVAVSNVVISRQFSVTSTRGKLLMVVLGRYASPREQGRRSGRGAAHRAQ